MTSVMHEAFFNIVAEIPFELVASFIYSLNLLFSAYVNRYDVHHYAPGEVVFGWSIEQNDSLTV